MEYYPGGTLTELIKREGALDPKDALGIIRQVATGLAYAHQHQIIHRDIKPANIFLANDDYVKLGDFGICKHYDIHDRTVTGEVMGTPLYMAPEQTKDARDVDPRSDIYALGMTLYHMLTGKPPRVVDLELLDPELRPLVKKLTSYEREKRPVSAEQLIAMINQTVNRLSQRSAHSMTAASSPAEHDAINPEEEITPTPVTTRQPPDSPSALALAGPDEVTVTDPQPLKADQGAAQEAKAQRRV